MLKALESRNKRIRKALVAFAAVILVTFFCGHATVHAQDTRSWMADFLNPTFSITLGDGDVVFKNATWRESINTEINTGGTTEYSLYDRFGPDIKFFCYCGEVKIQTGIIDKLYTFVASGDGFSIRKAIDIFTSSSYYVNNRVYEGRVDICNSNQDPRYVAWTDAVGLGGVVSLANFYFNFAKWLEDIEAFFISDKISEVLVGYVSDKLSDNTFFEKLETPLEALMMVLTIFCIIWYVRYAFRYMKGQMSFWQIIGKTAYALLAFALMWMFVLSPFKLLPIVDKLIEVKQDVMDEALDDGVMSNGVISGSDNQVEAMLWFINIYEPWCHGTYDRGYYDMYTQYAEDVGEMPTDPHGRASVYEISDDNVFENWTDGELRYGCKYIVGDCKVMRSSTVSVRNWAALGYSMQSKYHIDATRGTNNSTVWPNAETCVRNPNLYVDDFRYIDALLNISEEFDGPNSRTGNIPTEGENAPRGYGTGSTFGGAWLAIYRVVVLNIPLLLFSVRRIVYTVEMMFLGIMLIWNAINYLVKFDEGPFQDAIKKFVDTLLKWILMNIMLLFALAIYAYTYETFFGNIAYLVLCIILFIEAPALTAKERYAQSWVNGKAVLAMAAGKKLAKEAYNKAMSGDRDNKYSSWEDGPDDDEDDGSGGHPNSNFGYEDDDGHDDSPEGSDGGGSGSSKDHSDGKSGGSGKSDDSEESGGPGGGKDNGYDENGVPDISDAVKADKADAVNGYGEMVRSTQEKAVKNAMGAATAGAAGGLPGAGDAGDVLGVGDVAADAVSSQGAGAAVEAAENITNSV